LCERAVYALRETRNANTSTSYSGKSLPQWHEVLGSELILRPLITCWSGNNVKKNLELSKIGLSILQKLIQLECIVSDSFLQVLSSIRDLLPKADIAIQLKLVQILLELPNTETWQ
ncbi:hypothetical protein RFI_33691, partial [Reticulomyxa filosa]